LLAACDLAEERRRALEAQFLAVDPRRPPPKSAILSIGSGNVATDAAGPLNLW